MNEVNGVSKGAVHEASRHHPAPFDTILALLESLRMLDLNRYGSNWFVTTSEPSAIDLCDALDFDQRIQWILPDSDRATRGLVIAEHLGVHGVHALEIAHVFEENGCFCDVLQ